MGIFDKLKSGLAKTRDNFSSRVDGLINSSKVIDEEFYDQLEELLILADVGAKAAESIINDIKKQVKQQKLRDPEQVRALLKDELKRVLSKNAASKDMDLYPRIILVVGVNGVGKTTTIGKLAYKFKQDGRKVLLAAADTFRAAATEQLEIWSQRAGVDIVKHEEGSDPAAVVFDAIQSAKAKKADVIICDTAGRLHNKKNLMEELKKVNRVVEREYPEAYKEVLLVLDATTGQNAVSQARVFKEAVDINSIALTKLDGTAKGGVIIAIADELSVPVKYIGVGEGIDDLQDFEPQNFVSALLDID
ncbi:signal recognition particle-docking protein FtsY [Mahella australiensis]|uniref:Signal recognition particle receptor FtsY n=1 Tax=Mahella australiensis (strain DSM 15567 / CIP 107919 / 50-1 BON) TaxID=697281 RepID=F4A2S2_MAHA5|nr:signal recognition particle-docking protein FtsY [Mahella australiensis]AEE96252.1 signal recognition particle-docking protein FtsY [Mahella australiensis 50-1 BON]